jgi:ketosteroid isomerase-like protein
MTDKRDPVDKSVPPHREETTTPDLDELNRRFIDASNRRDIEALMSCFAPEAVWHASGSGVVERLRGLTEIRETLEDWLSPYQEYEAHQEELLDLGNGVAFAVAVSKGRPVGSSAVAQWRQGFVVLYDGDLILRIASYGDIDEARAAAERLAEERG